MRKCQISFCKYDEHAFLSLSNCVSGGVRRDPILSRLYTAALHCYCSTIYLSDFSPLCVFKRLHTAAIHTVKALPLPLFVGPWVKSVHMCMFITIFALWQHLSKKGFPTWQIINGLSKLIYNKLFRPMPSMGISLLNLGILMMQYFVVRFNIFVFSSVCVFVCVFECIHMSMRVNSTVYSRWCNAVRGPLGHGGQLSRLLVTTGDHHHLHHINHLDHGYGEDCLLYTSDAADE